MRAKPLSNDNRHFYQGIVYACGQLVRSYDQPGLAKYILGEAGIDHRMLRRIKADSYDALPCKKALRS